MMVKTSELSGAALDWAVAEAEGLKTVVCSPGQYRHDIKGGIHCSTSYGCHFGAPSFSQDPDEYSPSTDWSQGGPLIEKHEVRLSKAVHEWWAKAHNPESWPVRAHGATPLIAACRAIVAAKLGNEVDIPEELIQAT